MAHHATIDLLVMLVSLTDKQVADLDAISSSSFSHSPADGRAHYTRLALYYGLRAANYALV